MKIKIIVLFACLLAMFSDAEALTVRPLEWGDKEIKNNIFMTRIIDYDTEHNTAEFVLYQPEIYCDDDIQKLETGDSIVSGGYEYVISKIERNIDIIVYYENENETEPLYLTKTPNGYWQVCEDGMYVWNELCTLTKEIPRNMIFMDRIEKKYGAPLYIPIFYSSDEFIQIFISEQNADRPGFDCFNIYVAFDGSEQPSVIERFHVPWW